VRLSISPIANGRGGTSISCAVTKLAPARAMQPAPWLEGQVAVSRVFAGVVGAPVVPHGWRAVSPALEVASSPAVEVGGLLELSLYFFEHHILDLDGLDRQEREGPWAAS
jgi:hypothetical protein